MHGYDTRPAPLRVVREESAGYDADRQASFAMTPTDVLLDQDLSSGAVRTYGILALFWWPVGSGRVCQEGHKRLVELSGFAESTLRKYLDELFAAGYIGKIPPGPGRPVGYCPLVEPGDERRYPGSRVHPKRRYVASTVSTERRYVASTVQTDTLSPVKRVTGETDTTYPVPASESPKPGKVAFRSLSEGARAFVDDWRSKQGRKRPPELNPAQAEAVENAVVELGLDLLARASTWAAENAVPEIVKTLRAARTIRKNEEDGPCFTVQSTSDRPRPSGRNGRADLPSDQNAYSASIERYGGVDRARQRRRA